MTLRFRFISASDKHFKNMSENSSKITGLQTVKRALKNALKADVFLFTKITDFITRLIMWCFGVLLFALIILQLAFWGGVAWLNSPYGQKTLQSVLGGQLDGTDMRIVVGGANYAVPTKLYLGSVRVFQNDKEYIALRGMHLKLGVFPLSRRELTINASLDELTLHESKAQKPKETKGLILPFPVTSPKADLPELPFDRVLIDNISIAKLTIKGDAQDMVLSPSLNGRVDVFNRKIASFDLIYKDLSEKSQNFLPKSVKVRGQYNAEKSIAQIRNFSVLAPSFNVSGTVNAELYDGGDLSFDGLVQLYDLKDLSPVSIMLNAKNTKNCKAGLNVNATYQKKPVAITAIASVKGDNIVLDPACVNIPSINAGGSVSLNTGNTLLSGAISGKIASLTPYKDLVGTDHEISPVIFKLGFTPSSGIQKITWTASTSQYRYIPSDLKFMDVKTEGNVLGNTVTVTSFSARDTKQGTFKGSGDIAIDSLAVNMSVRARDLELKQGDLAQAKINADINLKTKDGQYSVNGELRPDSVVVKLPERFSTTIPEINVVERGIVAQDTRSPPDILQDIALNVLVDAPSQIFVRGWGLDAEFGGTIRIKGFADDPQFHGAFSTLRGRYSEFGRNFTLKRGKLVFDGAIPPSPRLDILTETKTDDVLAYIEIKGNPTKPKIEFSSQPALPEDEVLSRILFGKDMKNITPFQAVKLTQTLRRFSGTGGGGGTSFDPLDTIRSATGLDDLRVEADEDGGATVGAGKYLTDKVYLEFETGSEEGSGNANLEIELTPNITVESEIGQDAQGGAGIFWKYDY